MSEYRFLWLLIAALFVLTGTIIFLDGNGSPRFAVSLVALGLCLFVLGFINRGRRLFSEPEDNSTAESKELLKDLLWRNNLTYGIKHYGFMRVLFGNSSANERHEARKERVRKAKQKAARNAVTGKEDQKEL